MAKQRLFTKPPENDTRGPYEKFSNLAAKIVTVPKAEVVAREKEWQRKRPK